MTAFISFWPKSKIQKETINREFKNQSNFDEQSLRKYYKNSCL